jgi:hypothetical protein
MKRGVVTLGAACVVLAVGLLAVPLGAQNSPATSMPTGRTIADFAPLAGVWKTEPGQGPAFEEHWMAPAGGVMCGMGRMVAGDRLVFFEFIRISQEKDGSIVYHALPFGRGTPTPFTLTSFDGKKAVFENPEHDDPKVITYTLDGDRLTAVTEGEKNGKPTRNVFSMQRSSN